MAIQQITDHAQQAISRLLQRLRDGVSVPALVTVVGGRAQVVENALWAILTQRFFSGNPTGQQLDNLGKILGLPRNGQLDAAYLRLLRAQVRVNRSGGTLPDLIAVMQLASDPGSVVNVVEQFPASVAVRVFGVAQTQAPALQQLVKLARLAGVGANLEYIVTGTDATTFTYDGTGAQAYDNGAYAAVLPS